MNDTPNLDDMIAEYERFAKNQKQPEWSKWLDVLRHVKSDAHLADTFEEGLAAARSKIAAKK